MTTMFLINGSEGFERMRKYLNENQYLFTYEAKNGFYKITIQNEWSNKAGF